MKQIQNYNNEFNNDILFLILEYNDDYTVKRIKNKIFVYEPKYKIAINNLNYICSSTDHCSVKSWRDFNHYCMKKIYKKINYHDFHLMLNNLKYKDIELFIEIETLNMLHHLSLHYYQLLYYIYNTSYPIIVYENKQRVYGIFWDFCKFYFMTYKQLEPRENSFLL